jgi:hypothetical protein
MACNSSMPSTDMRLMLHPIPFADAVRCRVPAPVALRILDRPAAPALRVPPAMRHHAGNHPAPADILAVIGGLCHGVSHKAI